MPNSSSAMPKVSPTSKNKTKKKISSNIQNENNDGDDFIANITKYFSHLSRSVDTDVNNNIIVNPDHLTNQNIAHEKTTIQRKSTNNNFISFQAEETQKQKQQKEEEQKDDGEKLILPPQFSRRILLVAFCMFLSIICSFSFGQYDMT